MRERWTPLVLLALAVICFWRLWPTPDGFLYPVNSPYSDLTITHWPNARFIRQSLAAWAQIPLWRPSILGGEPFASNPLSGLWYPPNLLLLVIPLTLAVNLLNVLHTAWAGWGGYRLARAIGASRAGGLLAALTLMFAPKAIAHLAAGHVGLYFAWAWLPWTLWGVRRLREEDRPRDVAILAVIAAMLISSDLRLGFYGGLAATGYWVRGIWVGRNVHRRRRLSGAGLAAALLATALLAVQVIPLAAVAGRLNRGGLGLEESSAFSVPPPYLVGLLVANHGGFHEWMTYLGAVGLVLAVVGVFRWRDGERWWWGGLALAATVYSLGSHTPLYGLVYRTVPALGWLRGPGRAWFLVVLAVAALAARGLTALERSRRGKRRRADLAAVGLLGAAVAGGGGGLVLRLPANVLVAAVIWPLAGGLVALRAAGRLGASTFAGLVLGLALVDLGLVGATLYRVRPADEVLAEGEAAAAWLAAQPGPFRVYSPSYAIPQHTGAAYGIETVDGVDPFQLADYAAFMRAATRVDLPGYGVTIPPFPQVAEREDMLLAHREVVPNLRLLGLLNVRYLAAAYPIEAEGLVSSGVQDGVYLYRNKCSLPRAFVIGRAEAVEGLEETLAWLAENDPSQAAAVESGSLQDGPESVREANLIEWTPNRIQVEAEGPGLLVLSEVYDPDWHARVDERAAGILPVDGILRGVYLSDGLHRVVFRYRSAGLAVGCAVSAIGWACVVLLWGVSRRRQGA